MYYKIEIVKGDVDEIENHLKINGYNFDRIENKFYVLEDEIAYVETILKEHGCDIWENDVDFIPRKED